MQRLRHLRSRRLRRLRRPVATTTTRRTKSGGLSLAKSGDHYVATDGDFLMAMDTQRDCNIVSSRHFVCGELAMRVQILFLPLMTASCRIGT